MKPFLYPILMAATVTLTACQSSSNNKAAATMAPTPAAAPSAPAPAKVTVNLTGQWTWTCCDAKYTGTLTLQQDGDKLTGRMYDENDTTGGSVDGFVEGAVVKFTRKWGEDFSQDYTLAISADGTKIDGDFDGTKDDAVGTHYTATKK